MRLLHGVTTVPATRRDRRQDEALRIEARRSRRAAARGRRAWPDERRRRRSARAPSPPAPRAGGRSPAAIAPRSMTQIDARTPAAPARAPAEQRRIGAPAMPSTSSRPRARERLPAPEPAPDPVAERRCRRRQQDADIAGEAAQHRRPAAAADLRRPPAGEQRPRPASSRAARGACSGIAARISWPARRAACAQSLGLAASASMASTTAPGRRSIAASLAARLRPMSRRRSPATRARSSRRSNGRA